ECLRAHAGARAMKIAFLYAGHEPLHALREEVAANAAQHLAASLLPVAGGEAPEPAVGERLEGIAQVDIAPAVAFARECEHGVGAGVHVAFDAAREVDAEEGEGGIGDGVDEGADE